MKLARLSNGSPEIFYSIQGEGRNTGMPAVFIRTSRCNLHCHWCDTDYTWNWDGTDFAHEKDADPSYQKFKKEEQTIGLPVSEVAAAVGSFPAKNFIFTGGEPLLHERHWIELIDLLTAKFDSPHFEIETNGTLLPGDAFIEKIHQINVSPKLENSCVSESARLKPEILQKLAATEKADFKFVVSDDLDEVLAIVKNCQLPKDHVFLMPKACSVEELNTNQGQVAAAAQKYGFRYSDRLHLRLFGAKRGV